MFAYIVQTSIFIIDSTLMRQSVTVRLQQKFGKLWIAAEVILFVLVGAAVDIRYTLQGGAAAVMMIMIGLIFRSVGNPHNCSAWCCRYGFNL